MAASTAPKSLLSLDVTVTTSDGTEHQLRTTSYDLWRAEQLLGPIAPPLTSTTIFTLAWSAARRAGIAGDDFEAWIAEAEVDLGHAGAEEAGDPGEGSSPTDSPQS